MTYRENFRVDFLLRVRKPRKGQRGRHRQGSQGYQNDRELLLYPVQV